ncbi:MAG: DUF123 domain-containing protein, partial [Gammaproteobacteria bacterium]|nr:DUF123 domain-containing protein [Gammaproteobacteria bacterium]NIU54321.1 DUF123 domain-containing protein [Gemmatimonadota bacterium]NIR84845.1 DUF123 domain-containing protein [Gammaproteobacteria bacterium]NIU05896.1 DUF123 domain-containing protein [Gammaproteobacteria bacterium]NIV52942.1 DUF123 domain-containing protein [Gammaproteobacteria bacterium]
MRCDADARVRIGRLGLLQLQPGFYLYAGSALGPGGVRGRLAHHRKIARRPRWHVDYLRCRVQLAETWYALGAHRCEHEWAGLLEGAPGVSV